MSDENEKEKSEGLSDIVKKVLSTGFNAAFMTEDAIKNAIKDLPLPKEIVNGLLANARSTKTEFISSVKKELKQYLDKIDVTREIDRVLRDYDLEVNAKIKFSKKKFSKENESGE